MLTAALYERFSSRGEADYADKVLSAMRFAFGGHLEKKSQREELVEHIDCENRRRAPSGRRFFLARFCAQT